MTSSYNYKTYYKGTPRELEESGSLVLLRSGDIKISLDTLDSLGSLPKTKTARKSEDGVFKIDGFGVDLFDFDTILYVNTGRYVGYTVFSDPQRCYSSAGIPFGRLEISLSFKKINGDGSGILVKLKTHLDSNAKNTLVLDTSERWGYQKSEKINHDESGYLKFTNKPSDYLADHNLCMITDSGVAIPGESKMSGFHVLSGVEVDSGSFSVFKPVMYKGDLAILKYSYRSGEYCVSSLSTKNVFGRPYDYLSGMISDIPETLLNYGGQILLFSDQDQYVVYFMETGEKEFYPKRSSKGYRNHIIIDPLDPTGKIRYTQELDLKKELSQSCIVPAGFSHESYVYQEKIGEWWCFRSISGFVYLSVYGMIVTDSRIHFINSRLGLYLESGSYHFLPIDMGHTYMSIEGTRILDKTNGVLSDIIINPSTKPSDLPKDLRCFLDGLRKKPLRTFGCLPGADFLESGLGMIFYMSDGLLYCY